MAILQTDASGLALTDNSGKPLVLTTGSVLQVVQQTNISSTLINSNTTWIDTPLSASITPKRTTSKILVFVNVNTNISSNGHTQVTVFRGETNLGGNVWGFSSFFHGDVGAQLQAKQTFQFLDSPATTSSITYSVRGKILDTTKGNGNVGGNRGTNVITLMEISG